MNTPYEEVRAIPRQETFPELLDLSDSEPAVDLPGGRHLSPPVALGLVLRRHRPRRARSATRRG